MIRTTCSILDLKKLLCMCDLDCRALEATAKCACTGCAECAAEPRRDERCDRWQWQSKEMLRYTPVTSLEMVEDAAAKGIDF